MTIQPFDNGESLSSVRSKINANFAELDARPSGQVDSVVAGTNVAVDDTDPANPVVSLSLGADDNFVTDAEKTILANTSGINSGDETESSLLSKLTVFNDTKESTGWVDNEKITVTYGAFDITLTHPSGTLEYYWRGEKRSIPSPFVSAPHPDIVGNWYLSSADGTNFVWSTTQFDFSEVMAAFVQKGTSHVIALRETHGAVMDWATHKEFHETTGSYLSAGGDMSSFTLNSTTAANRRPNVATTTMKDEDLSTILPALTSKSYTIRNLTGAAVRNFQTGYSDIILNNGSQPFYNLKTGGTWSNALFPNNAYGAVFLVALPATSDSGSQTYRYLWVQPQQVSTTLSTIQALTPASLVHGDSSALVSEFVFIGKVIVRYAAGNWTLISVEKLTGTSKAQTGVAQTGLTSVTTDSTLTGDGTTGNPLSVVPVTGGGDPSTFTAALRSFI